ncbi:hypothetical protein H2136_20795 [Aeromonas hydrophila]|uniref:Uncharacterized protein n=1 Tax=Aeromonas hydrophila TaxID=644 RepID=A0A926FP45_AERHY|nr:hypothetical protein [Aeromonas hydrophila]
MSPSEKTVYLQIKNTSNQDLLVDSKVAQSITAKGYRVISNPEDAHYWIQANVLKVEKMDLRAAQSALEGGWGPVPLAQQQALLSSATTAVLQAQL